MTYRWILSVMIPIIFTAIQLDYPAGSTTSPSREQSASPQSKKKPVDRKAMLLSKLKALLEPVGITVNQSSLIDVTKVKMTDDLTIEWEAYPDSGESLISAEQAKDRPPAKNIRLVRREKRHNSLQQHYGFDITTDDLFIVGTDTKSRLKWWKVIVDPRIVRAEWPGSEGQLTGQLYYRPRATIFLSPPNSEGISEIRIFLPKWTGSEFVLEQLTTIPIWN